MTKEKKKNNIGTYAVIMILSAVFIIIIAAMADHRENKFETEISQQSQINQDIQNRIVTLENENARLKGVEEEVQGQLATTKNDLAFYQTVTEIYTLALQGNPVEATARMEKIDESTLTEEQKVVYDTMKQQLYLPATENTEGDTLEE